MLTLLARPGSLVAGATVELDPDQRHHLKVRRRGAGAEVRLVDGAGCTAVGRVEEGSPARVVGLDRVRSHPTPSPLTLAVGAGARDRFGWLVEKAAELGVTRVVPVITELCAGVAARLRDGGMDRVRRRAREALTQCGSAWAPLVEDPRPLARFVGEAARGAGARWLATADGRSPPVAPEAGAVVVAVGPEGGFTGRERDLLVEAGFEPTSLGVHTLRFETAAIVAAALVAARRPD